MPCCCAPFLVVLITIFCCLLVSTSVEQPMTVASVCELPSNSTNRGHENKVNKIECPGPDFPSSHTECCRDDTKRTSSSQICCPQREATIFNEKSWIVMGALIAVCSLIPTIVVAICAFWSKCPLYNTCRPKLTSDITFGVEAGPNAVKLQSDPVLNMKTMPTESSGEKTFFWPKLKTKKDVDPVDL